VDIYIWTIYNTPLKECIVEIRIQDRTREMKLCSITHRESNSQTLITKTLFVCVSGATEGASHWFH